MTQSVYGILAQPSARATTSSSSVQAGGGGFASYLSAALGTNNTTSTQAQAASSGQYNPLPSRSLVNPFSAPVATAPEHSGQFKALNWPGAYRPEAGQEDVVEASGLPEAISTYGGDYFNQEVSLSPAQSVGGNIFQFHFPHIIEKDGTYYA
ncbi:MAG: hypothetical protein HY794_19140, partial [Desulfarculus sp.]|nr:hypothetical protein [Desulfarculus sp.]